MKNNTIYTIGYGTRSINNFLFLLIDHNIKYLVDVRSSPYSKYKSEYNKNILENILRKHHIRYVYMGDLLGGLPSDHMMMVNGRFDYSQMSCTDSFQAGLRRIIKASNIGVSVAIMCSEGKPEDCHRSKLIGEALQHYNIPVVHIDENGENKSQEEIIDRITRGQQDMFGNRFTSRYKYKLPGEER